MLHKEFRERLAKEYRYAVGKMQQMGEPAKKLYYFSVFFGEAQRILNFEWDRDLALIYMVTHQAHTLINATTQTPVFDKLLPIEGKVVYQQLTEVASDLADYFEKKEDNRGELCQVLGRLAEIAYAVSGNGSYLLEKGAFKL